MQRRMVALMALTMALAAALLPASLPPPPLAAQAVPPGVDCATVPLGALPPAQPIWCESLGSGPATFQQGPNAWVDPFEHGLSNATIGDGYVTGVLGGGEALHWRHQQHWMVDLAADEGQYPQLLAAWLRPNRPFRPDAQGQVVIELEVAVPIASTRGAEPISDSWPELVLSTADAPTTTNPWGSPWRQNGTYLYEAYPYDWTFGCRLQQSRHPICALYQPNVPGTPSYAGGPDRLWELNQNGGDVTDEYGGDPSVPGLADLWAVCASVDDPDVVCRNTFRWTLSPDRVRLDVQRPGAADFTRYYEAGLIDTNLAQILNHPDGFYVFFGDVAYQLSGGTVLRFHWDRLAVNPHLLSGPPPGSSTPTPTPAATPTPPTPTPSATATAPATATSVSATATATAPSAPVCEVAVRVDGVEQWVRKPAAFCASEA